MAGGNTISGRHSEGIASNGWIVIVVKSIPRHICEATEWVCWRNFAGANFLSVDVFIILKSIVLLDSKFVDILILVQGWLFPILCEKLEPVCFIFNDRQLTVFICAESACLIKGQSFVVVEFISPNRLWSIVGNCLITDVERRVARVAIDSAVGCVEPAADAT